LDWIALYGAALSTALAIFTLYRWIRSGSEERIRKVRIVLEKMLGPITEADESRNLLSIRPLVDAVRDNSGPILGEEAVFKKMGAEYIWTDLKKLVVFLRESAEGMFNDAIVQRKADVLWNVEVDGLLSPLQEQPKEGLLPRLRKNISRWLSDHA
jgi:hypothetical protein